MNLVVLQGNLTRDPEIKVLNIGGKKVSVANFTLAVSRNYTKNNGDKEKETNFFNCEAWDTGAETIGKFVSKGSPLLIHGSLKNEQWEKDGVKNSRTKVRVSEFQLLYRKPADENYDEPTQPEPTDKF